MKKKKTPTQKKRQYKTISYLCFGGEFVSVFAPFIAIGIVNYDKYFVQYDGTKMSIAAVLTAALMGLATWLVSKKKFENSFITLIIGWFSVAFIFLLLGQIINDIAMIMFYGGIGILGAYGLDIGSKESMKKANKIQEAIDQAIKENTVDDYKEELKEKETKKVRIKVKK